MALKRQMEVNNTVAYLQGAYFTEALMATVGNMFAGKTAKKHEYPDKPYNLDLNKDKNDNSEQERQIALLKAQLNMSMSNFNLSKKQRAEQ